ncbi:MAG: nodulation protein NfeD [Pseudomonadota bacterium]
MTAGKQLVSVISVLLLALMTSAYAAEGLGGRVAELRIEGAIGPVNADFIVQGIRQAEDEAAAAVLLTIDTPGGLMTATRGLIKAILGAEIPVICYVSPSGAQAASAGTYILLACHVAAMAPTTNLGSATPVQMGGLPGLTDDQDPPGDEPAAEDQGIEDAARDAIRKVRGGGSAMEQKVLEDAVAYIRELALRHGRNADWAEGAVRSAANLGAEEALAQNVVDLLAPDTAALLQLVDGRSVSLPQGQRTLNTAGLDVVTLEPGWRTRLLSVISNPNIAYFLMLIGFYGILFELYNPGGLIPGVVGATCLILALFAFQVLSVNYAGLALMVLGIAFMVAEAFVPSFGILGIGGLFAFVAGSIILMDGTGLSVSLPLVGGTALLGGAFLFWAIGRFLALRRHRPAVGLEAVDEEKVYALDDFTAEEGRYVGHVRMSGERWRAVSEIPARTGQRLKVVAVDGLTVQVVEGP